MAKKRLTKKINGNKKNRKYETELIPIPTPEFYVFYNGKADWAVKELKLSDAFKEKSNPINLELKVTLINIRAENNSDILQRCAILNQYSRFVQAYEANKGSRNRMGDTIRYCVEHDILREYIERKGKEVLSMLTMDWDYEEVMEVAREESEKIGKRSMRRIIAGYSAVILCPITCFWKRRTILIPDSQRLD